MAAERTLTAWPLVHARTRVADFRPQLLARPSWLQDADFAWIKRHLFPDHNSGAGGATEFGARVYAEALRDPGGERWVYLRKDDLVVFGVAAVATTLSTIAPLMTHETTHDFNGPTTGRKLDAFVGFAYRPEGDAAELFVPTRDLQPYQAAYETCVRPRWDETRDDPGCMRPLPSPPFEVPGDWPATSAAGDLPVDDDHGSVRVFPRADDERLWRAVATCRRAMSLVVGLPELRYAAATVFDIATTAGTTGPRVFERPPSPVPAARPTATGRSEDVPRDVHAGASRDLAPIARRQPPGGEEPSPASRRPREAPSHTRAPAASRSPFASLLATFADWVARKARGQDGPPPRRGKRGPRPPRPPRDRHDEDY